MGKALQVLKKPSSSTTLRRNKGLAAREDVVNEFKEKLAKEKPQGTKYKPETYMVVTRWTEKTKVKYIPNPKTPSSKSYPRYEKYSKAKTIGEALKLGAFPPDLLWDYERGFYKVVGGNLRDEPIDVQKAKAEGMQLTQTDEILGRWVFKELCRETGKTPEEIRKEVISGESAVSHALRLLADMEAGRVLEEAKRAGRKVTNAELLVVLRRWAYYKNSGRINVMPEGRAWVNSDTVGLLCSRDGTVNVTRPTLMYPNVMGLMSKWIRDRQPEELGKQPFHFTSINMNFGYGARRHRDGNNTGLSMLAAFGDFKGGELNYWPDDDRKITDVFKLPESGKITIDVSKEMLLFDGHRCHSVNDFNGERYSLVWFTCARFWKAKEENLKKLGQIGFVIPTESVVKSVSKVVRAPGDTKSTKAGALTWPITEEAPQNGKKRAAAEIKEKGAKKPRRS